MFAATIAAPLNALTPAIPPEPVVQPVQAMLVDATTSSTTGSTTGSTTFRGQLEPSQSGGTSPLINVPAPIASAATVPLFSSGTTAASTAGPSTGPLIAQAITPADDGTHTQVTQQGNQFDITAGTAVDQNLFHSFEQFNLDTNQIANFVTGANTQNILTRVVGGDLAVINGMLQVTGSNANVYLMNPAGIIFGRDASLNLPASFTATTATGIGLGGHWFNALTDNNYDLLTGNPDSFLFNGDQPGTLINAANLAVQPGETLSLIAGSTISTGSLTATNGQVLVQSVTGEKVVRLRQAGMLLSLDVVPATGAADLAADWLALPDLLTGGNRAATLGLTVAADGTVHITDMDQPLAIGDVVAQRVTAGTTSLAAANHAYIGDVTTHTPAGGGSLLVAAGGNLWVGTPQGALSSSALMSHGGDIVLHSKAGEINTENAVLNSGGQLGQRGGDITLYGLGPMVTGDITSHGGDIQLTSTGQLKRTRRRIGRRYTTSYSLSTAGDISIRGDLDTRFNPLESGGQVTLHGFGRVTTRNILTGGGDLAIYNGSCEIAAACNSRRLFDYDIDIDTLGGILNTSNTSNTSTLNSNAIGGSIVLHGLENVFTQAIASGGGDIQLLSHNGHINTTAGSITSANSNGQNGGSITIDARGRVTTADVSSQGQAITIDADNTIDTQQGTLDSSQPHGTGGEIILEARRNLTSGDLISGQGNISLTSQKGRLIPRGVIDTRPPGAPSTTAAPSSATGPAVGNLIVRGSNVDGFADTLAPGQLQLAASGEVKDDITSDTDGPSLGSAPNAPPPLSSFNRPSPNIPVIPEPVPPDQPSQPSQPPQSTSEPLNPLPLPIANVIHQNPDRNPGARSHQLSLPTDADSLEQLGMDAYAQGNYKLAAQYYEQWVALTESTVPTVEHTRALAGLAAVYGAIGQYGQAIEYYQTALAAAQALGETGLVGAILNGLGMVYYAQQDYERAIATQQQSLEIAHQTLDQALVGQVLSELGLAYYAKTDYAKAVELQRQSLDVARALGDARQVGIALEYLGLAHYALDEFLPAVDFLRDSLAIAHHQSDLHAEARRLNNLGDALYRAGDASTAIKHLSRALDIWDSLRQNLGEQDLNRVAIFETQETTYSTLQQILAETGEYGRALEMAERGRARAFVELLQRDLSPPAAQRMAGKSVDVTAPGLAEIQAIAKRHNATLITYSIIQAINDDHGRRQLNESELYIWVVKPNGQIEWRHQDLSDLHRQGMTLSDLIGMAQCFDPRCWEYQTPIANRDRILHHPLHQLRQLLIDPVTDLMPTDPHANLVIIPHQDLFLVPFAALQDSHGNYLIEQHTLQTAPSIQVLDLTQQQQLTLNSANSGQPSLTQAPLVVGNPTMPEIVWNKDSSQAWPLSPLPGSGAEATQVAALLQTKAITGDHATESTIVKAMQQASTIHLATHGLLDYVEASGVPGAIALTPSDTEDGLLTTQEIMDLNLTAELVVLSACDTGRGQITSDGVIGLSRSLLATGAPSVMVSLWKVPDLATQTLMVQFYQQLEASPHKAQALRQAMLATMDQYPSPRDWAAFTLMGQG